MDPPESTAIPGMLQSGMSRELFERWATDSLNGIIIAGYHVEGTLARELTKQPKEVTADSADSADSLNADNLNVALSIVQAL
jgi:cleavage and polyadenylation specificity factor subunit 3